MVERVLAEQLKIHIKQHRVLPKSQHGFRPKHSPESAIIELIDEIASQRDQRNTVVVASADLAGAFDTVDHERLVEKLQKRAGIEGAALELLGDYLKGRSQRTKKNSGGSSGWVEIPWGVPQGSVMGPLLFALFCEDLQEWVPGAKIVQFADDVTLITSDRDPERAVQKMNEALEQFERYAAGNWLAPEPTKTQVLYCTGVDKGKIKTKCEMAGQELEVTEAIKILGFHLDERLSGEEHCAKAAGKAAAATAAIKRATRYLRKEDKVTLLEALAHPYLDYCQNALYNTTEAADSLVRRAYNRTARVAAGLGRTKPSLKKVGWASWEKRREATREAMVAKVVLDKEPQVLWELLPPKIRRDMALRGETRGELETPAARLSAGEKAFRVWGPRVYNESLANGEEPEEGTFQEEEGGGTRRIRKQGKAPKDEDVTEREGYYGYLNHKFKAQGETENEDGWVVAWTDGSKIETGDGEKAGAGIFYGAGNPRNRSCAVGSRQTSQRGELTAFLECVEKDERKLVVRTDSRYVQLGVTVWMQKWKKTAWYSKPLKAKYIENIDLWKRVDKAISRRENPVKVEWVKAHGLPRHIAAGLTTEVDIWGNDGADLAAGRAARA